MIRRLLKRPFLSPTFLAAGLLLAGPLALRSQQPGSLDPTFQLNGGDRRINPVFLAGQFNFTPFTLVMQPAGDGTNRLIVGGDNNTLFRVFLENTPSLAPDGSPILNLDGTPRIFVPGEIDQAFFAGSNRNNGFGVDGRIVYSLAIQQLADGTPGVLVGGFFGTSSNTKSILNKKELNFIRLRANGAVESISANPDDPGAKDPLSAFNVNLGTGANDVVLAILPRRPDFLPATAGRILLGGQFLRFNTLDRGRLVQLNADGTQDKVFNDNLGSGANGIVFTLAEAVGPGADQFGLGFFGINGQVYVCGDFDRFNGKSPGKLVRLNADGTLDTTFAPKIEGRAIAVAVQADGKVLVGGDLDTVNGKTVNNIARLNLDGTSDTTFQPLVSVSDPKNIPPTSVYVIRVQADGKILIGGNYQQINGVTRRYLGRLLTDGTLDFAFDATDALVRPNDDLFRSPNAVQAIVVDPTFSPSGAGFTSRLIVSQTRADRKEVPGDDGYFSFAVNRLNTDEATVPSPLLPVVSLTAINGQITEPTVDLTGSQFGRLRVTRFGGNLSQELTVRVKATAASSAIYNGDYQVEELRPGVVVQPFETGQFTVTLPANVSSTDLIIVPTNFALTQDRAVTFKVKGPASGSSAYTRDPATRQATVAVFFNRG